MHGTEQRHRAAPTAPLPAHPIARPPWTRRLLRAENWDGVDGVRLYHRLDRNARDRRRPACVIERHCRLGLLIISRRGLLLFYRHLVLV